ncbi:MAG: pilus assembly protein [Humibacillus sp.]|nr:pilus assembly protein [Humibacillus sp.]MDN5777139.1 pilus assembly protein [Humibacillus sp.]
MRAVIGGLRVRLRQQTGRPDAGVVTVEFAVIASFAALTLVALLQLGLYFHAYNVARSGAQVGVQAGRVDGAGTGEGISAARTFVASAGGSLLQSTAVSGSRTGDTIAITVSGTTPSVVPFVTFPRLSTTVEGPVERITQ